MVVHSVPTLPQEPGKMFSPSTDVSHTPLTGQILTTQSISSASTRTSNTEHTSWHSTAGYEGVGMDEVHRAVSDFLGLSAAGGGVVKQEVVPDEQPLTEENLNTTDENQTVGYHLRTRMTRRDSPSYSSTESDDMDYTVIKKPKQYKLKKVKALNDSVSQRESNKLTTTSKDGVSVSVKLGVSAAVDNSEIDKHWVGNRSMFKCNVCSKLYERMDKMRVHVRSHFGIKPFVCNVQGCQKAFNTLYCLHKHNKTMHLPPKFECSYCSKMLNCNQSLERHIERTHTKSKLNQCEHCDESFYTKAQCHQHVKVVHEKRKHSELCEICGIILYGTSAVAAHQRVVHFKTHKYNCKVCKVKFSKVSELEHHRVIHQKKPIKCGKCPKTFATQIKCNIHQRTHLLSFKCDICEKVFKSKLYLENHLLQHRGIRKYCCKVCTNTFAHYHYLLSHMKSHGEKKFICDLCGGRFNRKDNLKSHIIRHMQAERKKKKLMG